MTLFYRLHHSLAVSGPRGYFRPISRSVCHSIKPHAHLDLRFSEPSSSPLHMCAISTQHNHLLNRSSSTMAANTDSRPGKVYVPNIDVENLEEYRSGGYHPTVIGDTFYEGRYKVVHKLGFGGYSTIWLARDQHLQRYVSLKILVACQSSESNEAKIHRLLSSSSPESNHPGQRFVPRLLDDFTLNGPNGRHLCLVQEVAACSIRVAKEWSSNNMFPVEAARSIAAQLILGVSYSHSRGVCHGGEGTISSPFPVPFSIHQELRSCCTEHFLKADTIFRFAPAQLLHLRLGH